VTKRAVLMMKTQHLKWESTDSQLLARAVRAVGERGAVLCVLTEAAIRVE
jgi:hypothetical protein